MAYEMSKMKGKRPEPKMSGESKKMMGSAAKKMASSMKPAAKKKVMRKKM
jgi:hypothetical protein